MIAIIDYGSGNLKSVVNALKYLGQDAVITSDADIMNKADKIILPGVGSFGFMMDSIREKGLEQPIKDAILNGKPLFGICLGLQVLFEESEESPGVKGLGIFRGKVVRFRKGKVPQVGWNNIIPHKEVFTGGYTYFTNSYYVVPEDRRIIAAETDYNGLFTSAVQWKNITAVQFHPEKSGKFGLGLFEGWLQC